MIEALLRMREPGKNLKALKLKHLSVTLPNGNIVVGEVTNGYLYYHVFASNGDLIRSFLGPSDNLPGMACLLNGHIIVGEAEGMLSIYNPDFGGRRERQFHSQANNVSALACLPNGNVIVGAFNANSTLRVFNPNDGTLIFSFPQLGNVSAIACFPSGNVIVGGRHANSDLRFFNPMNGHLISSFSQLGAVSTIVCLPNGTVSVATKQAEGTVRIFTHSGKLVGRFIHHKQGISTPEELKEFLKRREMEKNYQVLGIAKLKNHIFFRNMPKPIIKKIAKFTADIFDEELSQHSKRPRSI